MATNVKQKNTTTKSNDYFRNQSEI